MPPSQQGPLCSCLHPPLTITPTQSTHAKPCDQSSSHDPIPSTSTTSVVVYIVTDTCYPTVSSFDSNIGTTTVDSAHSTKSSANARAKKIIYQNDGGGCTVDIDKIIEEVRQGLYTGIGVGGKEEKEGCCFARRCAVEGKLVDEDSEDEESGESGVGELDGVVDRDGDLDVDMG
ncbi:uncharacterized protein K460DRAFT_358476 [Cucurbitaria berberidis CBS 394.84]|uniref:Uncharacterized protein n=1 Tax=Cucurbitaria berberidis CBS 394.84 TaxID=1168544 RepID=A0A9P4G9R8_9PLEO|nr:uncharacterized protein K460DRAFT_358476 [Cucurbitaria berberidis CBS 394.84]KAF1841773.1 hypothetical protein K460DRAFT_358476 [Cucurbitaria berberidis CBS 394.84]